MKICPQCQKTYEDDTLNFCLDDGTVLTQAQSVNNEPPATVMMGQPEQTTPNQPFGTQNNAFDNSPKYQPSKSSGGSKSWIWAIAALAGVIILCGGGFIGLAFLGALVDDSGQNDY